MKGGNGLAANFSTRIRYVLQRSRSEYQVRSLGVRILIAGLLFGICLPEARAQQAKQKTLLKFSTLFFSFARIAHSTTCSARFLARMGPLPQPSPPGR